MHHNRQFAYTVFQPCPHKHGDIFRKSEEFNSVHFIPRVPGDLTYLRRIHYAVLVECHSCLTNLFAIAECELYEVSVGVGVCPTATEYVDLAVCRG